MAIFKSISVEELLKFVHLESNGKNFKMVTNK